MFYSILTYEIILFWLWFYEIIIKGLKDLSMSRYILNENDCACLRFREIGPYFYLYKFFREPLWSPPPYLKIRHIRLQNQCISLTKWRPKGYGTLFRTPFCERYTLICMNWPLSKSAPLVADPCRSVYIAHKMASDGVENTRSAANFVSDIRWSAWVCH